MEELRSHGGSGIHRGSEQPVGFKWSHQVTGSHGGHETIWGSCCHLHSCSRKSWGTTGSWVSQWAMRSRRALIEETKCKKTTPQTPPFAMLPIGTPTTHHLPPHTLELTGGPGSPFSPGSPGPSPPVTRPGSPYKDREQWARFRVWKL